MSSLLPRARSFLRGLRRPERLEAEMEEEMRFHLEMEAERLARERGLDAGEARRQAAIAFGGVEKRKEEGRDARGITRLSVSWLDFKLGLRMLRKHPGLTVVGGLGMATAIAIGAAFFSFLAAMLAPSLPLEEGDRIVAIQNLDAAAGGPARQTHLHDLVVWREGLRAVTDVGAFRAVERNVVTPDGRAEPMRVAEMTASGFRVAGLPPLAGRWLVEQDEEEGAPPVVVIGEGIWRGRFAGRADAVGATLQIGGTPHVVVGVMPDAFAFPVNNRLWTPLRLDPSDYAAGAAPPVDVFGRLAPGASLEQAQAQLGTLGRRITAARPDSREQIRPRVMPYTHAFLDSPEMAWGIYLVQLLVSMLLVVIAVNVAILVYARTATRTGEIVVRLALGASRARVVGQLFVEALVLSLLAAAVGLAAAWYALRQVNAYALRVAGDEFPFWWKVGLSPTTVVYVAGLAVLAAVIVGVAPGLKATGRKVQANLRQAGGSAMQMGSTWTLLIVSQVAIAVAILPATAAYTWTEFFPEGLAARSFDSGGLLSAELGMDRETPPSAEAASYESELTARLADRQGELLSRLAAEPGVAGVTYVSEAAGGTIEMASAVPGGEPTWHGVRFFQMEPALFEVFGAEFLAGRPFHPADVAGPTPAVVVNRSFAETLPDEGEVLGRRFRYHSAGGDALPGGLEEGGWYEIVGVVNDFPVELPYRWQGVGSLYHPAPLGAVNPANLVVRTRGVAPESFARRLREITAAVDPNLRLGDARPVALRQAEEERTRRQLAAVIVAVALSVVLLSAAGIHALMSFAVVRRRKEIGIRTALGARPRRILAAIFSRAAGHLAAGAGLGAMVGGAVIVQGGYPAGRAAALLLAVALAMLGVGLLAALGPARRGLRIQPMEALRDE